MKLALNRSKVLVDAATASKGEKPFRCPSCKKPVVLRKGLWNAPCFSHWPGEGSIECELFTSAFSQRSGRSVTNDKPHQGANGLGLIRLLLKGETIADYSLNISIPRCENLDWPGHISCQTALGEYRISAATTLRELFLTVPPEREYRFSRYGEVPDEYWAYFEDLTIGLSPNGTYFRYSQSAVQSLKDGVPLYWEERYWLFAERGRFNVANLPPSVQVETSPGHGSWSAYLLSLPPESTIAQSELDAIEECLGRRILWAPSGIHLVDPMPHHVKQDGTLCFPEGTTHVHIQNSDKLEVIVSDAAGSILNVDAISDQGLFSFCPDQNGVTQVIIDGTIVMSIAVIQCDIFQPMVPLIVSSEGSFELPMESSQRSIQNAINEDDALMVVLPIDGFRSFIEFNHRPWPNESNEWILEYKRENGFLLQIGDAGAISVEASSETGELAPVDPLRPLAYWLFSVGASGRSSHPYGLSIPDTSNLPFWILRLKHRRWKREFLAHLRYLSSRLALLGASDV